MPAPTVRSPGRPGRGGWAAGVVTSLVLATCGALLVVPSTSTLPADAASALLPADATRGKVTLVLDGADTPAELSDARLTPQAVADVGSPAAWALVPAATRDRPGATWFRESVVPAGGRVPARFRLRSVDERGVWLVAQDWGGLGLVLDGFLELPADAGAGRRWSSSGAAHGRTSDGPLRFASTGSASTPGDAARSHEGCLTVDLRTQLTGRVGTSWSETELWCPGKGVVAATGELRGTAYAVSSGGAPSPVTDAELASRPWNPADLERWQLRRHSVVAGDPTFGRVDATGTAAVRIDRPPVVSASGVVAFPTREGGDVTGLVPDGADLWAHWWARPGGQVTAVAADGSLVLVPTTARRLAAYRAGRTLGWVAALDDVAVAPPLPVGDSVAVATVSGTLTLLDARTGAVRWSLPVGAGVHTALAAGDGVVVTADTGSAVTAWDLGSGRRRWRVDGAADPYATTLLVAGTTVVVATSGTLTAYEASTGRRVWQRSAGLRLDTATVVGGELWLGVGDDLQAWSVADGRLRWALPGAGPVTTPASACTPPAGTSVGLARRGAALVAVDAGVVRNSWPLPDLGDDVLTTTCRGAGADVTAHAPDGSRPLVVLRLAAP